MPSNPAKPDPSTMVGERLHRALRTAADKSGLPLSRIEEEAELPSGWLSKQVSGSKLSCVLVMRAARYLGISVDDLMVLLDDPSATIIFPATITAPSDAWRAAKALEDALQRRTKG